MRKACGVRDTGQVDTWTVPKVTPSEIISIGCSGIRVGPLSR
jgi:hypothetical protein